MLFDRYQLLQLIAYATASEEDRPPEADRRSFTAVLYNEADAAARVRFMKLLDGSTDAQAPFQVSVFEPAVEFRRGAPPLRKGPIALVLLLGKDETDPNLWVDRGDYIPDPGMPESEAWRPLLDALAGWDTATLASSVTSTGWQLAEPRGDERSDPQEPPPVAVSVENPTDVTTRDGSFWSRNSDYIIGGAFLGATSLTIGLAYWRTR